MKKLKQLILLILVMSSIHLGTFAQQIEVFQGVHLSYFQPGTIYETTVFESSPGSTYNLGVNCLFHHARLKYPTVISAHFFHQKGSISYSDESLPGYVANVLFNTQFFVLGLEPLRIHSSNKRLEIGAGIEVGFIIKNNSTYYKNEAAIPFISSFAYFHPVESPFTKPINMLKVNVGYTFNVGNKCKLIPRFTFRLAKAKDISLIRDEHIAGMEITFRFP